MVYFMSLWSFNIFYELRIYSSKLNMMNTTFLIVKIFLINFLKYKKKLLSKQQFKDMKLFPISII